MSATATRVVAAGNALGEGILWNPRDQSWYWTDITAATLWRHCPASGATDTWPLPEPLASFALCEDDAWLLLGLASRLAFFHRDSGRIVPIRDVEPDLPTRINDGACDRDGRFVFGTKHEPRDGGKPSPVGSFYRLDADLSLHKLALGGVAIANGIAFSPDGRTMYCCDSPTRVIRRCEYTAAGEARGARAWINLAGMQGEPDGSTVDAEGGLWNAQWDTGRVVRYDADGRADIIIEIPVARPTKAALGGAQWNTLFVTSARADHEPDGRDAQGEAGNVFAIQVAARGLPEPRFAGAPSGCTA